MASTSIFAIVGASLAGASAAQTLRKEGFDGRVVLVGDERELPYERPPLSKGYLIGDETKDVIYVHDADWYSDHNIELRLGTRATGLDPKAHIVELADGQSLDYTKLLLATGSSPRRLNIPGAELDGVNYLRKVEDSERLKAAFSRGEPVVVIGAGWIGLETAAAARSYGAPVTIVEPSPTPLHRVLGPELGEVFAQLHRDHEVTLLLGTGVTEIRGKDGRVHEVLTSDGQMLAATTVIVGVGATPNIELAQAAGLAVDNGVLTNAALRTSDPDIHAAGDIANAEHPLLGRRIRVEHWANAKRSGTAAARAMLGQQVSYDHVPYFFTDQYDLSMEYTGFVAGDETAEIVYRGDVNSREFLAFWLVDGRVAAGMNVNVSGVTKDIEALVQSREQVDVERLRDSNVPLKEVASGPTKKEHSGRARGGLKEKLAQGMSFARHKVTDRFQNADSTLVTELAVGEARILSINGEKAAVYRDEQGDVYAVSATCTHMGCTVDWNGEDKSWDCPCHGSRFDHTGAVLNGPAKRDLPSMKTDF
ncbi:MAG: FAD-dependent oxidoreductase [Longispora sp.]|nr:FAD-dependent oxidoreductase [Longispora sp. (in: high G+C Gram-positive bacteria)]